MMRLTRAIYVSNACRRLTDPVTLDKTLQALTPVRQETLRSATTDVDLYRLLDDLGTALNKIFNRDKRSEKPAVIKSPPQRTAEIISLGAYRRQRRLKSSA